MALIRNDLMMIINESSCTDLWKAGRVTGWIEALMENSPQIFRSFVSEERMSSLHDAYKEENCKESRACFFQKVFAVQGQCVYHVCQVSEVKIMGLFGPTKKQLGERAQAHVIPKLLEVGHNVLVPYGDSSRYDLVTATSYGKCIFCQ